MKVKNRLHTEIDTNRSTLIDETFKSTHSSPIKKLAF